MPANKTYMRPMGSWWRRNSFYSWYMLREASSVFVVVYALVLLTGLWRLTQGQEAFDAWRASLASPPRAHVPHARRCGCSSSTPVTGSR